MDGRITGVVVLTGWPYLLDSRIDGVAVLMGGGINVVPVLKGWSY